ncbi:MAG: hypothetical protein QGD94_12425, partial [Planctomycetia bacterium]|nr:hypothetical protein [Planctomycetia bacterium]
MAHEITFERWGHKGKVDDKPDTDDTDSLAITFDLWGQDGAAAQPAKGDAAGLLLSTQVARPEPPGPVVPDPIQQLQAVPSQPAPSPTPEGGVGGIVSSGAWEVFRNIFPNLAHRGQDLNDDKSLILKPWREAAENIRKHPEQPVGSRGLDWAGAGRFLKEGLKAVHGTIGENIGPVFRDVNLVDRLLGPVVEAVAQTPESTLDEGVASEFWKMLKNTPEIATRWWEIFKAVQRGEDDVSLVRDATMAFVERGLIKPEHASLMAGFFSVASNPVVMHSLFSKTVPAVGKAIERAGARAKEAFSVRAMQKSTTLTGEMPGVSRPGLTESGRTNLQNWLERPTVVRQYAPTPAEAAAQQTVAAATKAIPKVTMPARPAFIEAGQPA